MEKGIGAMDVATFNDFLPADCAVDDEFIWECFDYDGDESKPLVLPGDRRFAIQRLVFAVEHLLMQNQHLEQNVDRLKGVLGNYVERRSCESYPASSLPSPLPSPSTSRISGDSEGGMGGQWSGREEQGGFEGRVLGDEHGVVRGGAGWVHIGAHGHSSARWIHERQSLRRGTWAEAVEGGSEVTADVAVGGSQGTTTAAAAGKGRGRGRGGEGVGAISADSGEVLHANEPKHYQEYQEYGSAINTSLPGPPRTATN